MVDLTSKTPFAAGESPFHAKGMMWLGARAFVESAVPGGVDALVLEPSVREFFAQLFVAPGWYDIFPMNAIVDAAAAALSISRSEYVRMSAVVAAKRDMTGVYSSMLNSDTPADICKRFASIQGQLYDFGKVQVVRDEPHRVDARAEGIPEPIAWWWKTASEAYVVTVIKATGAKNVKLVWHADKAESKRAGTLLLTIGSTTTWT